MLLFLLALGRHPGHLREAKGFIVGAEAFHYADAPHPRARVVAEVVEAQRRLQQFAALAVLGDLEQQLAPACVQPGVVVGGKGQFAQQLVQRLARLEAFPPAVQAQVVLQVSALAEAPRRSIDLDLFVLVDAEVGEHELGPVLVKVAEEHQPQAVADVHQLERKDAVPAGRIPGSEGARLGVFGEQSGQALGLAPRRLAEAGIDLGQGQQAEELREVQRGRCVDPSRIHQRRRRSEGVADLGIAQLAGAEQRALAHHHAHQQRPGGTRQGSEAFDEGVLLGCQQVAVTLADPVEQGMEVVQVVERIFEGGGHGDGGLAGLLLWIYTDIRPGRYAANGFRSVGRQTEASRSLSPCCSCSNMA
ncbi:hypothetical protein D9M71_420760 [compost metagenome]